MWTQVGPSPIPVVEIKAYLDTVGITEYQVREQYLRIIRKMDSVELNHLHKAMDKSRKK